MNCQGPIAPQLTHPSSVEQEQEALVAVLGESNVSIISDEEQ